MAKHEFVIDDFWKLFRKKFEGAGRGVGELIDAATGKLPEKSRQIYKLAWEENLSHKDIAEQLGITPKTVENHVGIALRKLCESLQPYYKQIFMSWVMGFFLD
ncbi:MAG: LuxR C-terminal-related transcriptional regulator [Prolixibacteraceae bacterium]|nr:LuxR C-terminal-related transcriptional regulator [Prolixibacteraceae bacterium]